MKTYQVEIRETLCMTVEIQVENAQQAEEMVRQAYSNQEYILDAEYFTGVEFISRKKEMGERCRKQKEKLLNSHHRNFKSFSFFGAEGRTRTGTVSPPVDFEFYNIIGSIRNVGHFAGNYRPLEAFENRHLRHFNI